MKVARHQAAGSRLVQGSESMGKCINHPDIETSYLCPKHQVYQCESCINCRDPGGHCKYRSSCVIRVMEKEEKIEKDPVSMRHQIPRP